MRALIWRPGHAKLKSAIIFHSDNIVISKQQKKVQTSVLFQAVWSAHWLFVLWKEW